MAQAQPRTGNRQGDRRVSGDRLDIDRRSGSGVRDDGIVVGSIVRCDGKLWRVGHLSDLRMRLDPVTPAQTRKVFDAVLNSYGASINISPSSPLEKVVTTDLSVTEEKRLHQLEQRVEEQMDSAVVETNGQAGQPTVAPSLAERMRQAVKQAKGQTQPAKPAAKVAQPTKAAKPAPVAKAAPQVAQPTVSANRKKNQERVAMLQAKKQATKAVKAAAPKKVKELKPCACGCGEEVTGYFCQGHDARFKGWLLKIERGEMGVKDLPKVVQGAYEWRKKGEGMVPTLNYKGEKHQGYDVAAR